MQVSMCKDLMTFSIKKLVLRELTSLAKCFKEHEKLHFLTFISVASSQILDGKDKILFTISYFVKRFSNNETIPSDVLDLFGFYQEFRFQVNE